MQKYKSEFDDDRELPDSTSRDLDKKCMSQGVSGQPSDD
jgi:hypothetical protein